MLLVNLLLRYCFALQVLEEAGIKLKRYAGSSIGAVIAALLAVGYSSSEVLDEFSVDLRQFFEGNCIIAQKIVNVPDVLDCGLYSSVNVVQR